MTMLQDDINVIINQHKLWLNDDKCGKRADFSESNLINVNLSDMDLRYIDFSGSDLSGCDFSNSDLRGCNLISCDLSYGNFNGCDLRYTDLRGSDLSNCKLTNCDFRGSDLYNSNLKDSDISDSDIRFLSSANGIELACINAGIYQVVLAKYKIAIGDKIFTIEEWRSFNDDYMSKNYEISLEWLSEWKFIVSISHKNIF